MKYDKFVKRLERLILREWLKRTPKTTPKEKRRVKIEIWSGTKWGLRVAEVGFVTHADNISGCAWLRSDTESVPFLVECLILEWAHFGEDEDLYRNRLLNALFGVPAEEFSKKG